MATRLLFCVTLCLLGVEPTEAGVTQTPRYQVTKKGQPVTLSCEPISGHISLHWYSQTSGQGPQMMIYFRNEVPVNKAGMPKDRFSAEMPNASFSTLKIQPTEPGDSAMYLCASRPATTLQSHPRPVHKPSCFPFSSPSHPQQSFQTPPYESIGEGLASYLSLQKTRAESTESIPLGDSGHMDAVVTQSPRYQIARTGKPVSLSCFQDMNHDTMYWYQQKLNQAPKLLFYYYDQNLSNETDTDNFQPSQPNTSFISLGIRAPGLGDSAVYLCASSKDTELEYYLPSAHKPSQVQQPSLDLPPLLQQQ